MKNTYTLGFDIVEPQIVFETFASFNLKVVDFLEHTNTYHIIFEGSKENLKRWYEEYYDSGESFEDYFGDFTSNDLKKLYNCLRETKPPGRINIFLDTKTK